MAKELKTEMIAFKVTSEVKKRINAIIDQTFHEDESQFMRYLIKRFLPTIEKEIEEELNQDETNNS